MKTQELETTARALVAAGKGLLAADESSPTIEKRFNRINVPSTEENRRAYRGQSQDGVKGMKTNKPQKRHAGKKRKANTIANAAVGAVVGGVIAGPVGAFAGAAVGAMVEKGPTKPQPRKPPTRERPADDPPSASGKRRPPANQKKPAGKGSRRKPSVTIAPPLAGVGPDVRISRRHRNSKPSAKGGDTRA